MNAIPNPPIGSFCYIPGLGYYQYSPSGWLTVTAIHAFPINYVYSRNEISHSGTTFNMPGYTFPDPAFITEDEGNLIFEIFVGGNKQYYRSPGNATSIGEFEIDNINQNLVFPVALDNERIQAKAYVL